jgi:hypothetical protein
MNKERMKERKNERKKERKEKETNKRRPVPREESPSGSAS